MFHNEFTNHSGGAIGSDTFWDLTARRYGFNNHNHYWLNNKTPIGNVEISKDDEIEGQLKATIAARQMGRIEETHQVRDERIIRNWCQVKYAEAIFAIGKIMNAGGQLNYGKIAKIIQVQGGTGYAVQMAINENKPVYFFDLLSKKWYLNYDNKWSAVFAPTLTKNWSGIGTRQLTIDGENAIIDVISNTNSLEKRLADIFVKE